MAFRAHSELDRQDGATKPMVDEAATRAGADRGKVPDAEIAVDCSTLLPEVLA